MSVYLRTCGCMHLYSGSPLAMYIRYRLHRGQKNMLNDTNDVISKISTMRYSTQQTITRTKEGRKEEKKTEGEKWRGDA